MARAGLEGDSRRLHRVRELALQLVDAAVGSAAAGTEVSRAASSGSVCVLAAAVLWGTTGTAAALAPEVGSLAVGAAAMGIGGLLQAVAALRVMRAHRAGLVEQWRTAAVAAVAVAVYPLAFYSSMRLAGVAVGTVVSVGSGPLAAAVIERVVDRRPLSRRWAVGAAAGLLGIVALAVIPQRPRRSRDRRTSGAGHRAGSAGRADLCAVLVGGCAHDARRAPRPGRSWARSSGWAVSC